MPLSLNGSTVRILGYDDNTVDVAKMLNIVVYSNSERVLASLVIVDPGVDEFMETETVEPTDEIISAVYSDGFTMILPKSAYSWNLIKINGLSYFMYSYTENGITVTASSRIYIYGEWCQYYISSIFQDHVVSNGEVAFLPKEQSFLALSSVPRIPLVGNSSYFDFSGAYLRPYAQESDILGHPYFASSSGSYITLPNQHSPFYWEVKSIVEEESEGFYISCTVHEIRTISGQICGEYINREHLVDIDLTPYPENGIYQNYWYVHNLPPVTPIVQDGKVGSAILL